MKLRDIRHLFIDYFAKNQHEVISSSSLVPHNDPTLLFINAGMNQFKDIFTGKEQRPYKRAVTAQKCIRAGGKHNDLENVGYTARHHTFFEMLGNFSFGDYFKEQAIFYAWDLLTKHFNLDPKRLFITVYHDDEEAFQLWKKLTNFHDSKIIRIATMDNFWSMGDTGPCGPCTEIFYDHGELIKGGLPGSDEEGDRFVEIWNLVFMQYEQKQDGSRINLPKPSVDTGAGIERLAAVLQGVKSNFEIDLFQALINQSKNFSSHEGLIASHNVIADHLRSCGFLIADGILPSNEGRGYVLRRIMRRAMRHAHLLGIKDPLMHRLVPELVNQMGDDYPELKVARKLIENTFLQEENRFHDTLDRGLKILNETLRDLSSNKFFPADVAFKLYDTYGFPLDLTQDILKEKNLTVDTSQFNACMENQKNQARLAWKGSGEEANDTIWFELLEKVGPTEFLGYNTLKSEGVILTLIQNSRILKTASQGDEIILLVNQSPFYGESGGQVGDIGTITTPSSVLRVKNTTKRLGVLHLHHCEVIQGQVREGDHVQLSVDKVYRDKVKVNHSATHLLQAALRKVLGNHVIQKGSLVTSDRLRFDFTHPQSLSGEEKNQIQTLVNEIIQENKVAEVEIMPLTEAKKKKAMALFGENYNDDVRVVTLGGDTYSMELCGGTHVKQTGDIGLFYITSESAVSTGIRRIEALTGQSILDALEKTKNTIEQERETYRKQLTALQKEIQQLKQSLVSGTNSTDEAPIGPYKGIVCHLQNASAKTLLPLVDDLKRKVGSGLVIITNREKEKISVVIGITKDLTVSLNAIDLVREVSKVIGGKGGGGRPDLAQAGGNNPNGINDILPTLSHFLR